MWYKPPLSLLVEGESAVTYRLLRCKFTSSVKLKIFTIENFKQFRIIGSFRAIVNLIDLNYKLVHGWLGAVVTYRLLWGKFTSNVKSKISS